MKLDLTRKQINALKKGKQIQLQHNQIGSGVEIALAPDMHKKVESAFRRGVGTRISGGALDVLKSLGVKKEVKSGIKNANAFMKKKGLPSLATDAKVATEIALDYIPGVSSVPRPIKKVIQKEINKVVDKNFGGSFRVNGGSFRINGAGLILGGLTPQGTKEHFEIKDDKKPVLSRSHPAYVTQSMPHFGKMVGDLTNHVDQCPYCLQNNKDSTAPIVVAKNDEMQEELTALESAYEELFDSHNSLIAQLEDALEINKKLVALQSDMVESTQDVVQDQIDEDPISGSGIRRRRRR